MLIGPIVKVLVPSLPVNYSGCDGVKDSGLIIDCTSTCGGWGVTQLHHTNRLDAHISNAFLAMKSHTIVLTSRAQDVTVCPIPVLFSTLVVGLRSPLQLYLLVGFLYDVGECSNDETKDCFGVCPGKDNYNPDVKLDQCNVSYTSMLGRRGGEWQMDILKFTLFPYQ